MNHPYISSPTAILATLCGICAFFFFLEEKTRWKLFKFVPPLVFVYAVPAIFSNVAVGGEYILARESAVYDWMGDTVLPMFLVLMLLKVDVAATFKVMGRGVFVMLFGTTGVVLGAPLTYMLVRDRLPEDTWKAFGTLAGSWIGGTGNMAATAESIGTSGENYGLAVVGDNLVYLIWLPLLLGSKGMADMLNRVMRVDPKRIKMLESIELDSDKKTPRVRMTHFLYMIFLALLCTWIAESLSVLLPVLEPVISTTTWKVLLITTMGLILSHTPAKKIPSTHELSMALVYIFVANIGAQADVSGLNASAGWFIAACYLWIIIHGIFCLVGAYLLRVDVHSTAIASAANIGGAASAPVVASHHNEKLVPVSILMALIGYAVGNYGAILAAGLCHKISTL